MERASKMPSPYLYDQ
ncbi:TPA: hypothetical protein ACM5EG_001584 [Escherichia coli]